MWSFPTGVWRILLWPQYVPKRFKRQGIGYSWPVYPDNPVKESFKALFTAVRASRRMPRVWSESSALAIPKKAGNPEEGLSLLHCLDCLGKIYVRLAWARTKVNANRLYSYGYTPGRRREHAILQINMLHTRLSAARISHAVDFMMHVMLLRVRHTTFSRLLWSPRSTRSTS